MSPRGCRVGGTPARGPHPRRPAPCWDTGCDRVSTWPSVLLTALGPHPPTPALSSRPGPFNHFSRTMPVEIKVTGTAPGLEGLGSSRQTMGARLQTDRTGNTIKSQGDRKSIAAGPDRYSLPRVLGGRSRALRWLWGGFLPARHSEGLRGAAGGHGGPATSLNAAAPGSRGRRPVPAGPRCSRSLPALRAEETPAPWTAGH